MTGIMRRCREKKMIKNDRICLHPRPGRSCLSYFQLQFSSLSKFYRWFLSIDNSLVIAEVYFNPKENLKKEERGEGKFSRGKCPEKVEKSGRGFFEMVIWSEEEGDISLEFSNSTRSVIRSPLLENEFQKGDLAAGITNSSLSIC